MRRSALLCVFILSVLPGNFNAFCFKWLGCKEKTTTKRTTEAPTTTTTTPDLTCKECSEFAFCEDFDEGKNVCSSCVCPRGMMSDCCDKLEFDACNNGTQRCPTHSRCEADWTKNFRCVCDEGRTGKDCSAEIDACSRNPCLQGGKCTATGSDFQCECAPNFTGRNCETPLMCNAAPLQPAIPTLFPGLGALAPPAGQPAAAVPCACKTNRCVNNATCSEIPMDLYNKYSCVCEEGFTGTYCEAEIPCFFENPCDHGGVCRIDARDATKHTCECPSIWKGDRCETYDPCHELKHLCVNGKCIANGTADAHCECVPGFDEWDCSHDIDDCLPNPCEYGSCSDLVNNFTCTCPPGSSGHRCEINFDDCLIANSQEVKCREMDKRAECVDQLNAHTCNCSAEWTGVDCTMRIIIWNVLQQLGGASEDTIGLMNELVAKPELIKDMIPFFLALMPAENQTAISWEHEDLFEWASFEGTEVAVRQEMVKWNAATLGNCFTFNHDSSPEKRSLRYAGEREGFRALMRVRQDEYLDWIDTASLLVFVHSSKESVFGESLRFQVEPGTETSLMISQSTFERLGGVYGVCVRDKDEVKSYYYEGEYTTDGCLRSCYQDAVFEACGCMDPRFPLKENVSACAMTARKCVMRVSEERGDPSNWPDCRCPLPCSNGQFNVRWSNADLSNAGNRTHDEVLISVHFPQMIQTNFKEEPKMDFNKFISNLGGLLGVLCGISILTFIEFAFLLFRLTVAFVFGK